MLNLYKPNKSVTGMCASFNNDIKDGSFYVSMLRQAKWENNKGSFAENAKDPTKKINIKLNQYEIGNIIHALDNNREISMFHTFDGGTTQIWLKPYVKEEVQMGYSLTVLNKKAEIENKFAIGITFGEAECLKQYFIHGLRSFWASEAARLRKEFKKKDVTQPEEAAIVEKTNKQEDDLF